MPLRDVDWHIRSRFNQGGAPERGFSLTVKFILVSLAETGLILKKDLDTLEGYERSPPTPSSRGRRNANGLSTAFENGRRIQRLTMHSTNNPVYGGRLDLSTSTRSVICWGLIRTCS